ncbi:MAG TPA: class II fumarate hydratase [Oligoflexus sp.]|uniref:class II fumarate hydratase n=1 Tax=Oligoflexus sp. TaxID=1971216 RepID=UPI002D80D935|nr:class II fumarate hydratase [Oligoflexus sp.]HET9238693.1 class II fumarate hydratase [Oligoflexus sp.]
MKMRIETDSLGEVSLPDERYYGAQTQRALEHFQIGDHRFPREVIKAFGLVKKAAALTNADLNLLAPFKAEAIITVCDEVIRGDLDAEFPLLIWQSGSGTQSNMNANEVIANRANVLLGSGKGKKQPIHPNDDINLSQSSNDVFPTVMHLAALDQLQNKLLPALLEMEAELANQSTRFAQIYKIGRTHLMDATPMTLGQEFSEFAAEIAFNRQNIADARKPLYEIALGGSAIGTGLNTHPAYAEKVAETLAALTGFPLITARNKFSALASHQALVHASSCLRTLATDCMKIANDIRWLGSGPRCGLAELKLPGNEPGSSIMPGKVNPTQAEALTMIVARVLGNDVTIGFAGSQGNFQLNVFKPIMIYSLLESITLLSDGCGSFTEFCLRGLEPRVDVMKRYLESSLMLVTALSPIIGYDRAAQAVKTAQETQRSLRDVVIEQGDLTPEKYDEVISPEAMTRPGL